MGDAGWVMPEAGCVRPPRAGSHASPIPHPAATGSHPASGTQPHSQSSRALMSKLPVILAITGASGAPYGVRLLEVVATHNVPTWLLISSHGWRLLAEECGITDDKGPRKRRGASWRAS